MSTRRQQPALGALGISAACMGTATAAAALGGSSGSEVVALVVAGALIWLGVQLAIWALLVPRIEPGPCWALGSERSWPGYGGPVRCNLPAGHAGAHVCDDLPHGGTITWPVGR